MSIELLSGISITDSKTLDKKTEDSTHLLDFKSEALRDIVRTVLQNIKGICLGEDKLMVCLSLSHTNRFKFFNRANLGSGWAKSAISLPSRTGSIWERHRQCYSSRFFVSGTTQPVDGLYKECLHLYNTTHPVIGQRWNYIRSALGSLQAKYGGIWQVSWYQET